MNFRSVPKARVQIKVPVGIAERVRILAVHEGRPDNEVFSRVLCLGLGIDPSEYGITSKTPEREEALAS